MAKWSQGFAELDGLKVHYTRTGEGSGKPQVVLMHGFTDNGLCWTPVALELEDTYDLIMPDARGHGRTGGAVDGFSTPQLAEDTTAFIRRLGLEKPYLFGHSMGAITAATVAANHPELVRAAILEDPPFVVNTPMSEQESAQQKVMMAESARKSLAFQKLPLEDRIARGKVENPGWSEAEIIPWAESKGEYNPALLQNRGVFREYPWEEVVRRITVPALLVTGDTKRYAIVSPETAKIAAGICPDLQVAHIEGAGHCIHRDRFAQTMQVVTDFLARN